MHRSTMCMSLGTGDAGLLGLNSYPRKKTYLSRFVADILVEQAAMLMMPPRLPRGHGGVSEKSEIRAQGGAR